VLEGRISELQQQLAAAQQKVEGVEASGRQLLQEKEQQVIQPKPEMSVKKAQECPSSLEGYHICRVSGYRCAPRPQL
jgi:hypothetical protein